MTVEERTIFIEESQPIKKLIVEELRSLSYELNNIEEDLRKYYYLQREVVDVLLTWIDKIDNPVLMETLVRHLAATKVKYDGAILTNAFDRLAEEFVLEKWAIASTLSLAKLTNIESWVEQAILNPVHGISRQMLCDVVAKKLPKGKAIELLEKVFSQMPIHASLALSRIGSFDEFKFLSENVIKLPDDNQKKYVQKVILKMGKRLKW